MASLLAFMSMSNLQLGEEALSCVHDQHGVSMVNRQLGPSDADADCLWLCAPGFAALTCCNQKSWL